MTGKAKVQPGSRAVLAPLLQLAEQLRTDLPGWRDAPVSLARPAVPSDLVLDLRHLSRHDADGLLVASIGDEVLGFAACYVRSRQLNVGQPWLLPEHQDGPVAELLLRRALQYGERSGAADAATHLLGGAAYHALWFRFGLRPRFPVYRLALAPERARVVGQRLLAMMPGSEQTQAALEKRSAMADLDRLDRIARGVTRAVEHEYWLAERSLRLATVRDGKRVAAYAYGGGGQCGPVAATTTDAGLAALGWALVFAAEAQHDVTVLVPATFETAVEQLLDAGARCLASGVWMTRRPGVSLERFILPSATLA
jgi:hypothetical protein